MTVHEVQGVYFVSGEFDAASVEDVDPAIAPALDGKGEVVLDLAGLTFIDSTGVRTLARLSQRIGGGIVLRHPKDAVIRTFELLQIDEMPGIRVIRN